MMGLLTDIPEQKLEKDYMLIYEITGKRVIHWVVDEYELYHRTISTLINDMVSAGFIIEECQESKVPESIREKRPDMFGGVIHQPDFIFFRCGKKN